MVGTSPFGESNDRELPLTAPSHCWWTQPSKETIILKLFKMEEAILSPLVCIRDFPPSKVRRALNCQIVSQPQTDAEQSTQGSQLIINTAANENVSIHLKALHSSDQLLPIFSQLRRRVLYILLNNSILYLCNL